MMTNLKQAQARLAQLERLRAALLVVIDELASAIAAAVRDVAEAKERVE